MALRYWEALGAASKVQEGTWWRERAHLEVPSWRLEVPWRRWESLGGASEALGGAWSALGSERAW
jgi:hypothetical protein